MATQNPKSEGVHILWNPNKNYLGSWDITPGSDLVLTIKSISWDDVEDYNRPIKQGKKVIGYETKSKRVVHFVEDIKPMICNEINAASIFKVSDIALIKDYEGKNIRIGIYSITDRFFGEEKEAIRIRDESPAPARKEVLTVGHKLWEKAGARAKAGEATIEDFRKHYIISDEDFNALLK